MKQYSAHLASQYKDRTEYWQSRAQSRLRQLMPSGSTTVAIIADALDHSKMKFPRTPYLVSKDMGSFNRPNLDLTACLVHGYAVHLMASMPFIAKDSNLSNDILLFCLHDLASKGLDTRQVDLRFSSDNTCREAKNNSMPRNLGTLVASSRLKRATYQCLRTGHSHEDIDAFLALVSNAIQSAKEVQAPNEFKDVLNNFVQNKKIRTYEEHRSVHLISAVREWSHSSKRQTFSYQTQR